MSRDNESWLSDLSNGGAAQHQALADLREILLRGLRRALSTWQAATDTFLEDVVQDSLIRILDRLDQFEGRSAFVTWATSIAIRIAMTELRRRRWRDVSLEQLIGEDLRLNEPFGQAPKPDVHRAQQAILEKMHGVIRTELTEKQRAALLAELKGMPQDEIARHLGSNRNAVYKLTHDARKRLKRGLEAAGYHATDVRAAFGG